ncbi:hypothetical protein CA13_05710 [Planctomycetes bacterium CA13]|uniref:Uncharacterized protein n=1 Tax=Novipirellula herctigrandis TaxID=2527986 RepID=A0A5C5YX94_9BACT|nr:hypothetical protein CA13_05710 [Planctomycetes bacterium CA13]
MIRSHLCRVVGAEQKESSNEILSESMLIRDGFFCGRCFHMESHRAIWFIEEDEVKIYGIDGKLQHVLSGEEIDQAATMEMETGAILKMPEPEQPQSSDDIRRAA